MEVSATGYFPQCLDKVAYRNYHKMGDAKMLRCRGGGDGCSARGKTPAPLPLEPETKGKRYVAHSAGYGERPRLPPQLSPGFCFPSFRMSGNLRQGLRYPVSLWVGLFYRRRRDQRKRGAQKWATGFTFGPIFPETVCVAGHRDGGGGVSVEPPPLAVAKATK